VAACFVFTGASFFASEPGRVLFVAGLRVFPLMPKSAPSFKRVVVVEPPVVKKAPVSAT